MPEIETKAPAYQWYARDFEADEAVKLMTLEEEGAYRRLLDHQWLHGSIPADLKAIAAICKNMPARRMKAMWAAISPCFHPVAGDATRLQNRRMERDRIKAQEFRDEQSKKGKHGATERWKREAERKLADSRGNGTGISAGNAQAMAGDWPDDGSAVCSLQSASALHQPPPGGPVAEMLLDRVPDTHRGDLLALLERVPDPTAWAAESNAALDGMPGHFTVTPVQLANAVRDFNANGGDPSLRLFRGYLRDASATRTENQRPQRGKRTPPGQYDYTPTTEPVKVQ